MKRWHTKNLQKTKRNNKHEKEDKFKNVYSILGNKMIDDSIRVNYQFRWFSQDFSSNTFAHSIWSDKGIDTLLGNTLVKKLYHCYCNKYETQDNLLQCSLLKNVYLFNTVKESDW